MPKRSKDRPADLGDEDYDWIKSLGEGRATSSPGTPSDFGSAPASPGGRDDGGRRRRDRDHGPGRRSGPVGGSAADDETGPGANGYRPAGRAPDADRWAAGQRGRGLDGFGLDNYGLEDYGAIGAAAFGHGGASGDGRRDPLGDGYGGRGPGGGSSGRSAIDYGSAEPGPAAPDRRAESRDSRTTPGRAVRLTAGRAVDLQANPAEALFNPAAEDYGQPLYPLHDTGVRPSTGPQPAWHDDPFADTDANHRARALPAERPGGGWPEFQDRSATAHWPDAGVRPGPADGLQSASGRATGWPETDGEQGTATWSGPTGWPEADDEQRTATWPEPTGWPEADGEQGTATWQEPTGWPEATGEQGTGTWPEPTGWPEADGEQGTATWSGPTGWPAIADESAFAPASELAGRSGLNGRTGQQPRVGDWDFGQGTAAGGATRQSDAAGFADTAEPGSVPAAAAAAPAAPPGRRKQKQSGRRQAPAGRKAAGRKAGRRKKAGVRPDAAIANAPQPAARTLPSRSSRPEMTSTGPLAQVATSAEPIGVPARRTPGKKAAKARKKASGKGRRRGRRAVMLACLVLVAALAVTAYVVLRPLTTHVISTPSALGTFTKQSADAKAAGLKNKLMAAAGSDVKNVVAAVYQRPAPGGTKAVPQVMVFIGGNLAGNASASSLISAYLTQMHGSFSTSPGKLGGEAACAPGSPTGNRPAECAWADGDTFGVVVSASLSPSALANEMRQMRPLVEHASK